MREIIDNSMVNLCIELAQRNSFPSQIDPELTWMLTPQEAFWPRLIARVCIRGGKTKEKMSAIVDKIRAGELPPTW